MSSRAGARWIRQVVVAVAGVALAIGVAPAASAASSNPDPVTNITVSGSGSTVTVSWSPPANTGTDYMGRPSPMDYYSVWAWSDYTVGGTYGQSGNCTTSSTSCTISGLTTGAAYYIEVSAYNDWVGSSRAKSSTFVVCCKIPGAPASASGQAGDGNASIWWSPPSNTGGGSLSYTVTASPGGATCKTNATSCGIQGLSNGTTYTFTVVATNSAGTGPGTTTVGLMPKGKPTAPQGANASPIPNGARVNWSPPASDGGVGLAQYVVVASPGDTTCVVVSTSTTCDFLGLAPGSTYSFVVYADNSVGRGPASAATAPVTTPTIPGPPQQVVAQVSKGKAEVSWVPPTDTGGALITDYVVVASPGDLTCTTTGLSCVVTGLSNGNAYSFTVTAVNGVGSGAPSPPSEAKKLLAVPTAPLRVRAKLDGTAAIVEWTAPKSTGGLRLVKYIVTSSPGGRECTTKKQTCRVTGLERGRDYVFLVQAVNARGKGLAAQSSKVSVPAPVVSTPPSSGGAEPNKPEQNLG